MEESQRRCPVSPLEGSPPDTPWSGRGLRPRRDRPSDPLRPLPASFEVSFRDSRPLDLSVSRSDGDGSEGISTTLYTLKG